MQVDESVRTYGRTVPLRSTVVYGGIPMDPQIKALRAGVEILVATPGRLLDLVGQKVANLGQVEILVLDEADRMLDMGFLPDIQRIIELLPKRRQNLMFSATFSDDIRRLSGTILRDPETVEVAPRNTTVEGIRQLVYPVDRDRKEALLAHLIRTGDLHQVLVFTRTKLAASRLASRLDREGIDAVAIHSDRSQPERTRALEGFKTGDIRVLVATDVAARGLDIEDLPVVVNFELPWNPQDYIHRIGRTGRAGALGRGDQPRLHRRGRPAARHPADAQARRSRGPSRRASSPTGMPSHGPSGCAAAMPGSAPEHHAHRKPVRRRTGAGAGGSRAAALGAGWRRVAALGAESVAVGARRAQSRSVSARRPGHRGAREEEPEHEVGLDALDAVAVDERVLADRHERVRAVERDPGADVAQEHELAGRSREGAPGVVARQRRQLALEHVRADLEPEGVPLRVDRDGRVVVGDGDEHVVDRRSSYRRRAAVREPVERLPADALERRGRRSVSRTSRRCPARASTPLAIPPVM